jgi:hypothetical protein
MVGKEFNPLMGTEMGFAADSRPFAMISAMLNELGADVAAAPQMTGRRPNRRQTTVEERRRKVFQDKKDELAGMDAAAIEAEKLSSKKVIDNLTDEDPRRKALARDASQKYLHDRSGDNSARAFVQSIHPDALPAWARLLQPNLPSEASADFLLRVSLLPPALSENPEVFGRLLTQYYQSVPWSTLHGAEFQQESNILELARNRLLALSRTPPNHVSPQFDAILQNNAAFSEAVDPHFDVYRFDRPVVPVVADYDASTMGSVDDWKRTTGIPGYKAQKLDAVLYEAQMDIDSKISPYANPDEEIKALQKLNEKLVELTKPQEDAGARNQVTIGRVNLTAEEIRFSPEDIRTYEEKISHRRIELENIRRQLRTPMPLEYYENGDKELVERLRSGAENIKKAHQEDLLREGNQLFMLQDKAVLQTEVQTLRTDARTSATYETVATTLVGSKKDNPEFINSPEVLDLIKTIVSNPASWDDVDALTAEAAKIAYRASGYQSNLDTRRDVARAVWGIRQRVEQISGSDLQITATNLERFDSVLYGTQIRNNPFPDFVYSENNPWTDPIIDPRLIQKARSINKQLSGASVARSQRDLQRIINDFGEFRLRNRNLPDNQCDIVQMKLDVLMSKANEVEAGNRPVATMRWGDIKNQLPPQIRNQFPDRSDEVVLTFRHINQETVDKFVRNPREEIPEWWSEFRRDVFSMGREDNSRASLTQEQIWQDFKQMIEFTGQELAQYDYQWENLGRIRDVINRLLYVPGDAKDKFTPWQFLVPQDLEYMVKHDRFAAEAVSFAHETAKQMMADGTYEYLQARHDLLANDGALIKQYDRLMDRKNANTITVTEKAELYVLQEKFDKIGFSVGLWDRDIQSALENEVHLTRMIDDWHDLSHIKESRVLTAEEVTMEKELYARIRLKYKDLFPGSEPIVAADFDAAVEKIREHYKNNKELSPFEQRTKDRLRQYLISKGQNPKDWELNSAVWHARLWMIGSGSMTSISSKGIRPAYEVMLLSKYADKLMGAYVMKSPAIEEWDRAANPIKFHSRFGFGGEMGENFRAIMEDNILTELGFKYDPKTDTVIIPDTIRKRLNEKDPAVINSYLHMQKAIQESGIAMSELLTNGIWDIGGLHDESSWRAIESFLRKYDQNMRGLQSEGTIPADAELDHQLLGLRFQLTKMDHGHPTADRLAEMKHMVVRNPKLLFDFLGEPLFDVLQRRGITPEERLDLINALNIGQKKAADRFFKDASGKSYAFRSVDLLGSRDDFNALILPALKNPANADKYFGVLTELKTVFFDNQRAGAQYKTLHEAWSSLDWPLTLLMGDGDLEQIDQSLQGVLSIDRRGRDTKAAIAAAGGVAKFETTPTLLHPNPDDHKAVAEADKELDAIRSAVNAYSMPSAAAKVAKVVAKTILEMNVNKGSTAVRLVPMAQPVLRAAMEFIDDIKPDSVLGKMLGGHKGIERLAARIGHGVSYSLSSVGNNGPALNEGQVYERIEGWEHLGIFKDLISTYSQFRAEYKATSGGRIVGSLRDNWWKPWVAVAVISLLAAQEDEKKHH